MKKLTLASVGLFLAWLVVSCAPKVETPAVAPQIPAPAVVPAPARAAAVAALARPAWQEKWETLQANARREGRVVIVTSGGSELRAAVTRGIKEAQGLDMESITGSPTEVEVKLGAERRAGLYLEDVYLASTNAIVNVFKPMGILEPLNDALVLPEVIEPKLWYKGELPWFDKDHMGFAFSIYPGRAIAINTSLVKPEEMKSWRDLLNPKWKGKLVLNDPTLGSAGQLSILAMDIIMGTDYIKELAKAEPMIIRDQRQQMEWLAHGKISVLIGPKPELFSEFLKAGAPVAIVEPVEGTWLSCGIGAVALFNNSPHPNAAKVFANWLLSKEGQTLFANAVLLQSARVDVPTSALPADLLRQPTGKYFPVYDEASLAKRDVTNKLAKDLFGPLIKK